MTSKKIDYDGWPTEALLEVDRLTEENERLRPALDVLKELLAFYEGGPIHPGWDRVRAIIAKAEGN